jgi:hypothetical protein
MVSNLNNPSIRGGGSGYAGFSSQSDVTGSRDVNGTPYHNTTSLPILCVVTCTLPSNGDIAFYSDSNATPTLLIGGGHNANLQAIQFPTSFVVLPGNYYKGVNTGVTNMQWVEST